MVTPNAHVLISGNRSAPATNPPASTSPTSAADLEELPTT
jgi:hypothetical protein